MKKGILAMVLVTVMTVSLGGCGLKNSNLENSNGQSYSQEVKSNRIEGINLEVDANKIEVLKGEGDVFSIKADKESAKDLKINNNGSILEVTAKSKNISLFGLNDSKNRGITITTPKNFSGDINLKFGAGEINIEDIDVNAFTIDGGAGDVNLNNISFKNFKYNGGVGEMILKTKKKTGNLDVKTGVGNTEISLGEIGGDGKFSCGMGNLEVSLPDKAPVKITSKNGVGSVSNNARVSGENLYSFDFKGGVGNIDIN